MNCTGIFGRLFGHDYRGRYSHGAATYDPAAVNSVYAMVFSSDMADVMAASWPSTYHGDVCRRCGHTVNTKEAKA